MLWMNKTDKQTLNSEFYNLSGELYTYELYFSEAVLKNSYVVNIYLY